MGVIVRFVLGVLVLVLDHHGLGSAGRKPAQCAEHQHPATPHPEVAAVAQQRDDHVDTEEDQRGPDHPLHDQVDRRGQSLREHDGGSPSTKTTTAWPRAYIVAKAMERRGVRCVPVMSVSAAM